MHADRRLLDWATVIAVGGPTWLEIVASHAHLLSATEDRNDTRFTSTTQAPEPSALQFF